MQSKLIRQQQWALFPCCAWVEPSSGQSHNSLNQSIRVTESEDFYGLPPSLKKVTPTPPFQQKNDSDFTQKPATLARQPWFCLCCCWQLYRRWHITVVLWITDALISYFISWSHMETATSSNLKSVTPTLPKLETPTPLKLETATLGLLIAPTPTPSFSYT